MQGDIAAIERLITEHGQVLEGIRGCEKASDSLAKLGRRWVPGMAVSAADEVRQLQECLAATYRDLSEHMRFEEEEFLPTLMAYAAEIVGRGLCFEHSEVLNSIAGLREKAGDLLGEPANREELLAGQAKIKEKLDGIRRLLEEHVHKAEMIADLARRAVESEKRQTR